jgi:hypothetical protein
MVTTVPANPRAPPQPRPEPATTPIPPAPAIAGDRMAADTERADPDQQAITPASTTGSGRRPGRW